jgi:hypothetical protein
VRGKKSEKAYEERAVEPRISNPSLSAILF